jgi:hypothetical protein
MWLKEKGVPPSVDWRSPKYWIFHPRLGGVTTASYAICIATRRSAPEMELLPYPELPAELDHIINPTARVPGTTPCAAPGPSTDDADPAESRTTVKHQMLDSERFRVRSVYTKTGWMRRKLTPQERLLGRDVPGQS